MKSLIVPRLEFSIPAREISSVFDRMGIESHPIQQVNWKEYPYLPDVSFRIAHTDTTILLNFRVHEQSVRAIYTQDNDPVWNDSCVEFFVQFPGENYYYNLECNAIGSLLLGVRENREKRFRASQEVLNRIERWTSLGKDPFQETKEISFWEISLVIPIEVFFQSDMEGLSGITAKANFYKCGDRLKEPHFVSWNRIETVHPDFHQTNFFGEIVFEE